ncbi:MAG: DUF4381 domain-containing protein [Gammaproteobacteria bacterium]|nr:DUF4381 domain-containing protein [Gammaproteobacteria bacterium]
MNEAPNTLDSLRDIHAPPAVSWWPPALGWWLVTGALLLLVISIVLYRHWRRKRALRRSALAELQRLKSIFEADGDVTAFVAQLSILLRRVALSGGRGQQAAGLVGDAWLRYLDQGLGERAHDEQSGAFSNGPGTVLVSAPYQRQPAIDDSAALTDLIQQWIEKNT